MTQPVTFVFHCEDIRPNWDDASYPNARKHNFTIRKKVADWEEAGREAAMIEVGSYVKVRSVYPQET